MQTMIIYASPRKSSNSTTLAHAFMQEAQMHGAIQEVYLRNTKLEPCRACKWCKEHHRCLITDAMNDLVVQFKASSSICFATPVYWWGVSAQLKLFIDRLYQLEPADFTGKRLYVIATGEDTLDGVQYRLIKEQCEAICSYTGMEFAGYLPVCAGNDNPAGENSQALESAKALFKAE
ncbi:MAG: flavodoxin family protein [Sphaerochaeta sp.]|uniref:flavodoxin family protein n=1 Tax=Sphaerochaeta sp. TaxID=1972642 RepID=UPI003D09B09D